MAPRVLLALLLMTAGVALMPTATAAEKCVVGNDERTCAVSVSWVVCVTDPCDPARVCVGYGRYCL